MSMRWVRLAGRLCLVAMCLLVGGLIVVQYSKIIARNIALSRSVAAARIDVGALREKRGKQLRDIERLSEPDGAVPEIHDRLHLVFPREELIYVKGAPTPAPVNWPSR
jgi:hypothetical protein